MTALLEHIYHVKFSKHTPLVVVLLSMIWTIYRTQHYLHTAFKLDALVSWPTAVFIELLVLAASASVFLALRGAYVAELKDEDRKRAIVGVGIAIVSLVFAFVALLFVSASDAWLMTGATIPATIMLLVQVAQALFIVWFIVQADLEERELLRVQYKDYETTTIREASDTCRYCRKSVSSNNRARHERSCVMRPEE